jgi:hypothetical protein
MRSTAVSHIPGRRILSCVSARVRLRHERQPGHEATRYRTCNLCEAMCGLAVELDGDNVTSMLARKSSVVCACG